MRYVWLFGAVALAAALVVGLPSSVSAHAEYDRSEPASGATVSVSPTVVKVWFTEEVRLVGSSLKVVNPNGVQVDIKDTKLDTTDHKLLTVSLMRDLPPATYKVDWKSVSADDRDEDEGSFSFTIRLATVGLPSPAPVVQPAPAPVVQPAPALVVQPAPATQPTAAPVAAPAPSPASIPSASPQPASVQVPQALPRTGSAEPSGPVGWVVAGGTLLAFGLVMVRRIRRSKT